MTKTIITIENGRVTIEVEDQDDPVVISGAPAAAGLLAQKPEPTRPAGDAGSDSRGDRHCTVCNADIRELRADRKLCGKVDCRKEYKKRYMHNYFKQRAKNSFPAQGKNRPPQSPSPRPPISETKRTVLPPAKPRECGFCRRRGEPCVRHGGSKAVPVANQRAPLGHIFTDKALTEPTYGNTKPFKPVDDRPPVKVFDGSRFLDPWRCQACRDLRRLCGTHKFMTDSGKKPPLQTSP
jgi:hypothetical protein